MSTSKKRSYMGPCGLTTPSGPMHARCSRPDQMDRPCLSSFHCCSVSRSGPQLTIYACGADRLYPYVSVASIRPCFMRVSLRISGASCERVDSGNRVLWWRSAGVCTVPRRRQTVRALCSVVGQARSSPKTRLDASCCRCRFVRPWVMQRGLCHVRVRSLVGNPWFAQNQGGGAPLDT